MSITEIREHVHTLVDRLPAGQLGAVEHLLESMVDPVSRALATAPIDDETPSAEEEEAAKRAKQWFEHNPGTTFEDLVAELGFSMDEISGHKQVA